MLFLSGDVGGTKTILAIYESKGKKLKCIKSETYPSKNYNCLEDSRPIKRDSRKGVTSVQMKQTCPFLISGNKTESLDC